MFTDSVLNSLRRSARRVGIEIRRNGPGSRADLRLAHYLDMHDVDLVLDVGANRGQFGEELFAAGFRGSLMSFEAMPEAHAILSTVARQSGKRWTVAPAGALSDAEGHASFNVTLGDTASSLLSTQDAFAGLEPIVGVQKVITVPTFRLDSLAADAVAAARNPFLKIDVQGAEMMVLRGATQVLEKMCGAVVEVCTAPIYEGQGGFMELMTFLQDAGLVLWDVDCGYREPGSYRMGCADITMFRPKPA